MWYREGTISLSQGSTTVTGVGTSWAKTENGVLPGMILLGANGELCEIKSVQSDTSLTLVEAYTGEDDTDFPCRIITTYQGDLSQFAARFAAQLQRMSADSGVIRTWLTSEQSATMLAEDGTEITLKSLPEIIAEQEAAISWFAEKQDLINNTSSYSEATAESARAALASENAAKLSEDDAVAAAGSATASQEAAATSELNAQTAANRSADSQASAASSAEQAVTSAEAAAFSEEVSAKAAAEASASEGVANNAAAAAAASAQSAKETAAGIAESGEVASAAAAAALVSQNAAKESESHVETLTAEVEQYASATASDAVATKEDVAAAAISATTASEKADIAVSGAERAELAATAAAASEGTVKDSAAEAAGYVKEAAASAAGAETSAKTATDALAGIEASALAAAQSAELASTKAAEVVDSADASKTSEANAKSSEDKAYEYSQLAQASVGSVKWAGTSAEMDMTTDEPKWVKVSRVRMPQSTSTVYIEVIGGAGYDADSPGQAAMADLVLRAAGGSPNALNAVVYRTMDAAALGVATVNVSGDNYDVYLKVGAGALKVIANIQSSGAVVESFDVIELIDALPDTAVEGVVYKRVISTEDGAITGSLIGNASTATVLESAREIGGVEFDGSKSIDLPGVNKAGNQSTSGNAGTATALETSRKIGGVAFDGSVDIDLPGVNKAGDQSTTGNAATASTLKTSRKIGGVGFDGSADINLPGVNIEGNQNTTGNAATATKLATARTINGVSFDGSANISLPTITSSGRVTALSSNTQGASTGVQMYEAYNNGYPSSYGNVIHLKGSTANGEGELFVGWSGTSGATAPLYVRSRRDYVEAAWSEWAQIYTTANKPTPREIGAMTTVTRTFSGGAGWYKIATVTMPQSSSVVLLRLLGGGGYNTGSFDQATISELVLRAGNNNPKGITATLWRRTQQGFLDAAWINTEGDVYDIYVSLPNYTTAVGVQWDCTDSASVTIQSVPEYSSDQPTGSTVGAVHTLYSTNSKPTAADVGALPLTGGTLTGALTTAGEIVTKSANGFRIAYGSYGMFLRNDGNTTYFLATAAGDTLGTYSSLRPLYFSNSTGLVTIGNGLAVSSGLTVSGSTTLSGGNLTLSTASSTWIALRTGNAIQSASAVSTGSAAAMMRQEHADRHFIVGGLGNTQFGIYMLNKTRTDNGTDGGAYLTNEGVWYCNGNGNFTDVYIRSDRRSKRNIRKIEGALDKIDRLEGALYDIKVYDRYEQSAGLIAQDVQSVQPELVTTDINDESGEERLRLNYNGVIGMLVEAVKELRQEVRELRDGV